MLYIVILICSVILHELGHLLASLYFKVPVHAFSIGFGPILLHKKWKNIDWRISLLPFGGYCDIEESLKIKNSLSNITYWKQCIILLAGVFANLMIALIGYLLHYGSITKGLYIDYTLLKYFFTGVPIYIYTETFNIVLFYTSFLNITLFIFNLLPIPALDGGYLWIFLLRKKMSDKFYKYLIQIGFYLLMIVQVVYLIYWWFK
jgi:membrane-associated protease RseP (regulator of RpoE activity)